ncbi:hypothetical protein [Synechococcus sp. 1G10]|uniref:hypothetical protein n=1 Tax=Synechococcus sp. 1G10 TaxID=2025605 RepID=UPI00117EC61B|nr:hypothetical protein [Synechococcus sp. 1G10]
MGLNLLPTTSSLSVESIFSPDFLAHLRNACPVRKVSYAGRNVVIHMRRGDITPDLHPDRFIPNHVYEAIIRSLISTLGSSIKITVHSQSKSAEPFSSLEALGVHLKLDASMHDAWTDMITADVLVLSKSSFSYVPALYNPNIVIYQPFWHAPLPPWISLAHPQWDDLLHSLHHTLLPIGGRSS